MNKFTKATKRITAVATSAVMASSAVFGAGLSNYPDNFNNTGVSVVIGADSQVSDSTAATMVIDSLRSESVMYEVTYTKSTGGGGGDTVDAVRSNAELNYGESLGNVTEGSGFDDSDTDVLRDVRFDNDIDDEEYEQTLKLENGAFNYALRDEVDGVTEITDGIFYDGGETFAVYTLEMNSPIDLSERDAEDLLVGHEMEIMGNEFVVADVGIETDGEGAAATHTVDKLVLTGGSQTYAIEEGGSISVPFGGRDYDVRVLNIDEDEVLLEVNGDAQSIDEYDSEDVSGLTIAVTDLVSGSQHTKGNAVFVVGGSKVTLEEGRVKINDEDVNDIYDDQYRVNAEFIGDDGMDTIRITYKVDDDTLLQAGDSLRDVLFDAFEVVYDGTNDVDYSEVTLSANDDEVTISGETGEGENLNRVLLHHYDFDGEGTGDPSETYFRGDDDGTRLYFKGSADTPLNVSNSEGVVFLTGSYDDAFMYVVSNVGNGPEYETDFDELLRGDDLDDVEISEWAEELDDDVFTPHSDPDSLTIVPEALGDAIPFENELYLELDDTDNDFITGSSALAQTIDLKFVVDRGDVDYDDSEYEDDYFHISVTAKETSLGSTVFDEFVIETPDLIDGATTNPDANLDWVNAASGLADNEDDDNDYQTYVNAYGVMVVYDSSDKDEVRIMTPDDQVRAKVNVVFGGGSRVEAMSESFATMSEAEARADVLREDSMNRDVEVTPVTEAAVSFDIVGPVLDTAVSGTNNMIVIGGPAVNRVAATLLGVSYPTMGAGSGLSEGQGVVRMFEDVNSVLVYGWSAADTQAAANRLNSGELEGSQVNVG